MQPDGNPMVNSAHRPKFSTGSELSLFMARTRLKMPKAFPKSNIQSNDTTMETKEEWMKDTKEQFAKGNFDATKMEITEKFETADMGALEVTLKEDGHSIRFSNVFLFKDKKIYRQLMHAVDG